MCFSPEDSFAGGNSISAIGIATIREVHKLKNICLHHLNTPE